MNRRKFVVMALVALIVAGAGTALARMRPAVHRHAVPRRTVTPTPRPTPRIEATLPSNGHHTVTGPNPVTERHVIHTTGSVAVVSGNISPGSSESGAVGTPRPAR